MKKYLPLVITCCSFGHQRFRSGSYTESAPSPKPKPAEQSADSKALIVEKEAGLEEQRCQTIQGPGRADSVGVWIMAETRRIC